MATSNAWTRPALFRQPLRRKSCPPVVVCHGGEALSAVGELARGRCSLGSSRGCLWVNSGDTSRSSTAFELLNRDTRDLSTWRLITTTAPTSARVDADVR
jgi:hypothetical protein